MLASQIVYLRRGHFAELPPITIDVDGEPTEFPDYPAIAKAYAEACVAGTNPVGRYLKLAAARYLRMLALAEQPKNEFFYSPEHVVDYCSWIERFEHFEGGNWENTQREADGTVDRSIILEPWQIWVESAIHGFRRRLTGERLVSTVLELMPRKNAKSMKAAPAALYDLLVSGTLAPEIPIAASSSKQADDTLFGDITKMVGNEIELKEKFKDLKVTQDEIRYGEGRIFKLSSQAERLDGLNPSLAIFEEGHAGAAGVYRVVDSAFGARPNALRRMITTAGIRSEGPAWDLRNEAILILSGQTEDYSFFAALYELDEEDYRDEVSKAIVWEKLWGEDYERLVLKANPMFGVSLDPNKLETEKKSAQRRTDKRQEWARTRFNIWTGSGAALIEPAAWAACAKKDMDITDFVGQRCWIGVDLASVLDPCSISVLFELPNDVIVIFSFFYVPAECELLQDEDVGDQLRAWAEDGWLTITEGALADHDAIIEKVEELCALFDVQVIACDPYQANVVVKYFWDGQRPVMTYANNAPAMTAPTNDLISKVVVKQVLHDGNPMLAWNAANVCGDRKPNGSILPRKDSKNSKRKIDGIVAAIFANGVRIQPEVTKTPLGTEKPIQSAYSGNRVIGLDAVE